MTLSPENGSRHEPERRRWWRVRGRRVADLRFLSYGVHRQRSEALGSRALSRAKRSGGPTPLSLGASDCSDSATCRNRMRSARTSADRRMQALDPALPDAEVGPSEPEQRSADQEQ